MSTIIGVLELRATARWRCFTLAASFACACSESPHGCNTREFVQESSAPETDIQVEVESPCVESFHHRFDEACVNAPLPPEIARSTMPVPNLSRSATPNYSYDQVQIRIRPAEDLVESVAEQLDSRDASGLVTEALEGLTSYVFWCEHSLGLHDGVPFGDLEWTKFDGDRRDTGRHASIFFHLGPYRERVLAATNACPDLLAEPVRKRVRVRDAPSPQCRALAQRFEDACVTARLPPGMETRATIESAEILVSLRIREDRRVVESATRWSARWPEDPSSAFTVDAAEWRLGRYVDECAKRLGVAFPERWRDLVWRHETDNRYKRTPKERHRQEVRLVIPLEALRAVLLPEVASCPELADAGAGPATRWEPPFPDDGGP
jgi:hypothetical protein